ncbi:META domain-containing protein [Sphingosinicella microcystinivorans]|uniref:META domain-containing protein n=1 Tax=Sphingosinicella microcystinivorans TaxID=335406 RepID=UPI0022F3B881|nr:META domain-containing protein [Sphingosinicella microcystinivorans]WBX84629.1 META domain-containing protein [Sphingosinicella microcystinivorans]
MKRSLGIVTVVAMAGCAAGSSEQETTGSAASAPAAPALVDTVWAAEAVAGEAPAPGARFQLVLGADGRASGRSGCNGFSARYELSGTALTVHPPMIGTMMACPEAVMAQEGTFRDVLEAAATATVGSDGRLTVTGKDGRTLRFASAGKAGSENSDAGSPAMPMPVPSHIVMRCGAEQLRVRLAEGKAQVVLEDGSEVELPRLAGDAGAAETYTNGRMTEDQRAIGTPFVG